MKRLFDSKLFRIIYNILRILFVIIIILYLSFIIIQRVTGNKSVLGYRLFTVATGSMSGVYEINDVIAVKDFSTKNLKVGDDVAYEGNRGGYEGMLITHRIVKIEDSEEGKIYTTKGVNAPVEDPSITESQILGKVVGVVPVITQLNHAVKSQLGFFLLVFCPLVIIIVLEVLQTITDIKLEKNEIKEIEKPEKEKKKKDKKDSTKDVEKEDVKEEVKEDVVDKEKDPLVEVEDKSVEEKDDDDNADEKKDSRIEII